MYSSQQIFLYVFCISLLKTVINYTNELYDCTVHASRGGGVAPDEGLRVMCTMCIEYLVPPVWLHSRLVGFCSKGVHMLMRDDTYEMPACCRYVRSTYVAT